MSFDKTTTGFEDSLQLLKDEETGQWLHVTSFWWVMFKRTIFPPTDVIHTIISGWEFIVFTQNNKYNQFCVKANLGDTNFLTIKCFYEKSITYVSLISYNYPPSFLKISLNERGVICPITTVICYIQWRRDRKFDLV